MLPIFLAKDAMWKNFLRPPASPQKSSLLSSDLGFSEIVLFLLPRTLRTILRKIGAKEPNYQCWNINFFVQFGQNSIFGAPILQPWAYWKHLDIMYSEMSFLKTLKARDYLWTLEGLCITPTWGKYETSTDPYTYAMLHM